MGTVDAEDKNTDQAHRRMVVHVNVVGEEEFSIAVQGRDTVLSVLRAVESRIGIAPYQQKISYSGMQFSRGPPCIKSQRGYSFPTSCVNVPETNNANADIRMWLISGKLLQEKKTLGSYLIQPESVLTVTMSKAPANLAKKPSSIAEEPEGNRTTPRIVLAWGAPRYRSVRLVFRRRKVIPEVNNDRSCQTCRPSKRRSREQTRRIETKIHADEQRTREGHSYDPGHRHGYSVRPQEEAEANTGAAGRTQCFRGPYSESATVRRYHAEDTGEEPDENPTQKSFQ